MEDYTTILGFKDEKITISQNVFIPVICKSLSHNGVIE